MSGFPAPNVATDVFKNYDITGDDNCWQWNGGWGGRDRSKRPYFTYGGVRKIAYRLVYELVHGVTLTSDQLIMHKCDRGDFPVGCGNPAHLELGNNAANMHDMKMRQRHGLPHSVIRAVRRLAESEPYAVIAERYGLTESTVKNIMNDRAYQHVKDGSGTDC